jgi:hypothetical protein
MIANQKVILNRRERRSQRKMSEYMRVTMRISASGVAYLRWEGQALI